MLSDSLS